MNGLRSRRPHNSSHLFVEAGNLKVGENADKRAEKAKKHPSVVPFHLENKK